MGKKRPAIAWIIKYRDGSKPDVIIHATSRGKAWRSFRKRHEAHANKAAYEVSLGG